MNILKYKKLTNGKYKVILENNVELTLYEDIILKYELLIKKDISDQMLPKIREDNSYYEAYYNTLKSLNSKYKSVSETKKYLYNKEYDKDIVEKVIDNLINQGYLNDNNYCISYINNQIITTNWGPYKIKNELIKKGIGESIIDENIKVFDDELQRSRINKIIDKLIKSNRTKAGIVLKNKIISNVINLGYYTSIVKEEISKYNFRVDKDTYEREYNKIYKSLSRKYDGNELEYKIKQKLYQKGMYYED